MPRSKFQVVVSLLAVALVRAAPSTAAPSAALQSLLNRIFATDEFKPDSFGPARWLQDGAAYTTVEPSKDAPEGKDIVQYDAATGRRMVLVSATALIPQGDKKPLQIDGYQWSNDRKQLLVFTGAKPVWRQRTRGDYWVLNLESKSLTKLGGEGEASGMQFAKFSPDGTRVAFVRVNNLFVQDTRTLKIRQLTQDGSPTTVNGTADWVYEEEFNLRDGFRWSPDGKKLAFWHFDSSGLGNYPLVNYTDSLYPVIKYIPYPKAGTTNSAVRIAVVDAHSGKARWMDVPGDPRNNYIPRMEWAGDSAELVIEHLNRLQNAAELLLADAASGAVRQMFHDQDKAWVDDNEIRSFGKDFVWLSERDGWRHAYLVRRDGSEPLLLTPGAFDVIGIAAVAEKQHALYYTASPSNATEVFLYRSPIGSSPSAATRITPANEEGSHLYNISPNAEWAFHTYSRFGDPPRSDLVLLPEHKAARVLYDNARLRDKAKSLLQNESEFIQVEIGQGIVLDGWMIRPTHFDESHKYPLLVYVYGEPAAQTVLDRWSGNTGLFHRALAADGYLVVSFDNRGTPAPKGRDWRKVVYGSVGPLAATEQTAAVKKLCEMHSYIDPERIAVWGWSGGGTDTLNLMFRSPDVFKVGMAVAPVPDQRLYDTIYQERYMGLPNDNPDGYQRGSAINYAGGLKGHLLIVHGTGDDNVHFQGSQRLINKLVELGKPFDFMEYPNRTHAISEGTGTTVHVYALLARYLEDHLPANTDSR